RGGAAPDLAQGEPTGGRDMNKQLLHVSVVALVLLAVLIVSTTYWQTWAVGDLANRQDNAVALVSRLTVDRGKILGAGGGILATNRKRRELAGRCGAVGAIDAKTGAIYAMASTPTYNANQILQPHGFANILKIKGSCGDASALVNNATAGLYPPGSTFKMVTAAAALDS